MVACQGGRTVGDRPAGAGRPEGQMAEGACPEAAPMQPEDLLQNTAPILTAVAGNICYEDIPPHASWHCRLTSCMRSSTWCRQKHRQGFWR